MDGLARAEASGAVDANSACRFRGGGICNRLCIGFIPDNVTSFCLWGGVVITTLITVPNWPLFNQHPLNWLDPSEAEKHPKPHVANSSSKKKTNKK
ncbi:hypothetical protein RHGRI_034172 [Rhododendron griersonianum]|uniref:Signal peptidase complex subunit 1 n=1 Tax=Rhododendron griersonianum TaxID=479676 RepID=A0AAV6I2R5_9ERIC|nr:hypothetical protein RHGRI_034172 [Rhododendron griersonianum]